MAASAFWVRDAGAIWFLYMKAVFILGGMIIPLELLPDGLQSFAMLLPFRAMAYAPARLASGHWEPALLVEQVVWIGLLAAVATAVFAAGERRLAGGRRMRGLSATARNAFAEVVAKPRALAVQMAIMAINDFVWVIFWVLFFDRVGTLGGWDRDSIILLQAVLTTAGGLSLGLFANARRVGSMAVDGDLDAVLALPVTPLPFVLLRRIEPVNLGDLAFGIGLFLFACDPTPTRTAIFVLVVLASATLLTGFLVLTGALAFFLGRSESGELGFHGMLLLGAYPVDLFAGAIRVLLFTVIPAAFVSAVPAQLVTDFDPGRAVALTAAAVGFAAAAGSRLHPRPAPLHLRLRLDPRLTSQDLCPSATAERLRGSTDLGQLRGRSRQGMPFRGSGSRGRPSTRSPMTLRWMSSVPPPIRLDHWNRKTSFQKPPSRASPSQSIPLVPRIDITVSPTCST